MQRVRSQIELRIKEGEQEILDRGQPITQSVEGSFTVFRKFFGV